MMDNSGPGWGSATLCPCGVICMVSDSVGRREATEQGYTPITSLAGATRSLSPNESGP